MGKEKAKKKSIIFQLNSLTSFFIHKKTRITKHLKIASHTYTYTHKLKNTSKPEKRNTEKAENSRRRKQRNMRRYYADKIKR